MSDSTTEAGSALQRELEPSTSVARTDYRLPEHRRAVFHDFYEFHLRYGAHPGCVYYLMPWLRAHFDWGPEEAMWFAFINGNTQNPVTSLLLFEALRARGTDGMLDFYRSAYPRLAFDTDRRYHKKSFETSVLGFVEMLGRGGQAELWERAAAGGFGLVWKTARSIPTFGRLSAFSFLEYVRIMGAPFDCDTLFLDDIDGSRSHRNGLCLVVGLDRYDWHSGNPDFPGAYPRDLLGLLVGEGAMLLAEARARAAGQPWEHDVSYFTLESTFCTYKGWHRTNRRYPNVYNDMLHDRIRAAEKAWPERSFDLWWEARRSCLPVHLRLEDNPCDPGLHPLKQNHYRLTGEVPVMGRDAAYARYFSGFDSAVDACAFGRWR